MALQLKSNIFSCDSHQIMHHFINFIFGTDTKCTDLFRIKLVNAERKQPQAHLTSAILLYSKLNK